MTRRSGDRVPGRRAYGGVLVILCRLNEDFRYWLLVDTGAAITMLSHQVAEEMGWTGSIRCGRNGLLRFIRWCGHR
jgi:hypothetical protein